MPQRKNAFTRLWGWVTDQIVQDVPEENAICAFDCDKEQCMREEWEGCERRASKAAGELMPVDALGEPAKISVSEAERA